MYEQDKRTKITPCLREAKQVLYWYRYSVQNSTKDQQNSPYFAKNRKVWYSDYLLPMVISNMYSICSQPELL